MKRRALYAGSFDPFTIGHKAIVERALALFDSVVIAIGHNIAKPGFLPVEARVEGIKAVFEGNERVEVMQYSGLTADFMKTVDADALLRGVRSVADFEAERNLADVNRLIAGVETVMLPADPQLAMISSSMVRELISFGHDVYEYVPDQIAKMIKETNKL